MANNHGSPAGVRPTFETETREVGSAVVVEMRGELDLASAEEAHQALLDAAGREPEAVVADLCSVNLLDSTGLMVLLDAAHDNRVSGFAIVCPGGLQARGVLSISGVLETFEMFDSREDLLHRFEK